LRKKRGRGTQLVDDILQSNNYTDTMKADKDSTLQAQ